MHAVADPDNSGRSKKLCYFGKNKGMGGGGGGGASPGSATGVYTVC